MDDALNRGNEVSGVVEPGVGVVDDAAVFIGSDAVSKVNRRGVLPEMEMTSSGRCSHVLEISRRRAHSTPDSAIVGKFGIIVTPCTQ